MLFKRITLLLLLFSITLTNICAQKKDALSKELVNNLYGYWISTNSDYEIDGDISDCTIRYYGEIDDNKDGLYIQDGKNRMYHILDTYPYVNKITISKYFGKNNGRESVETLTFSKDYNRIEINIVFPDGISVDTYYIRYEKDD
jgi:hypothetical protein